MFHFCSIYSNQHNIANSSLLYYKTEFPENADIENFLSAKSDRLGMLVGADKGKQ